MMAETQRENDIEIPSILLPCVVCNRTFRPEALAKHVKVCEKNLVKKRKKFDSSKQRIQGTDLAEFLPVLPVAKKPEKSPVRKTQSKWKEKHTELVRSIRAARCEPGGDAPPPVKPSDHEKCPHCERFFGPKAFDRHLEWCKEQRVRIQPKSPASLQAKERLEARTKYRAPLLSKSRRMLTKEKYSPHSKSREREPSPAIVKTAPSPNIAPSPISQRRNIKEPPDSLGSNFTRGTSFRGSRRVPSPSKKTTPSPRSTEKSNVSSNKTTPSTGKNKEIDDKKEDLFSGSCTITSIHPSENNHKPRIVTSSRKNSTRPRPCYSSFPCGNNTKLNDLDVNLQVPDITVTPCVLYNHDSRLKYSLPSDESISSIVLNKTYTKNSSDHICGLLNDEIKINEDGFNNTSFSDLVTSGLNNKKNFNFYIDLRNESEANFKKINNSDTVNTDNCSCSVDNKLKKSNSEIENDLFNNVNDSVRNGNISSHDEENNQFMMNNLNLYCDNDLLNRSGVQIKKTNNLIECKDCKVFTSSPVAKQNLQQRQDNFNDYVDNENLIIFSGSNELEDIVPTIYSPQNKIYSKPPSRKRRRWSRKFNFNFTNEVDDTNLVEKSTQLSVDNINYLSNTSDYEKGQTVPKIEKKVEDIDTSGKESNEFDEKTSKIEKKLNTALDKKCIQPSRRDGTEDLIIYPLQFEKNEILPHVLKTYILPIKEQHNLLIPKEEDELKNDDAYKKHQNLDKEKEMEEVCTELKIFSEDDTNNVSDNHANNILVTIISEKIGADDRSNITANTSFDKLDTVFINRAYNKDETICPRPNLTLEDLNTDFVESESDLNQPVNEMYYVTSLIQKDNKHNMLHEIPIDVVSSNENVRDRDYLRDSKSKSFKYNENYNNFETNEEHQYEFHSEENIYQESSISQCWRHCKINECATGCYTQVDHQTSYIEQCHTINNRIIQSHSTYMQHGKNQKPFEGSRLILPMIKQNYKNNIKESAKSNPILTSTRNKSKIPQPRKNIKVVEPQKVVHLPPITQIPTPPSKIKKNKVSNQHLPPILRSKQSNNLRIEKAPNNRGMFPCVVRQVITTILPNQNTDVDVNYDPFVSAERQLMELLSMNEGEQSKSNNSPPTKSPFVLSSPTSAFAKFSPILTPGSSPISENGNETIPPPTSFEDLEAQCASPPLTNVTLRDTSLHRDKNRNPVSLSSLSLCSSISIESVDLNRNGFRRGISNSAKTPELKKETVFQRSLSLVDTPRKGRDLSKGRLKMEDLLYGTSHVDNDRYFGSPIPKDHFDDPFKMNDNDHLSNISLHRNISDEETLNAEQELLKSLSEYENLFKSVSPVISSSLESLKLFPSLGCSSQQDQLDGSEKEKNHSRNEVNKSGLDSAYNSLNRKSPLNENINTDPGTRSSSESEGSLPSSQNSGARFCHECGNKYPVSGAKFCCNCGVRRLVM